MKTRSGNFSLELEFILAAAEDDDITPMMAIRNTINNDIVLLQIIMILSSYIGCLMPIYDLDNFYF